MKCRLCHHPAEVFHSFGQMPLANGFLTPDQIKDEYFFELAVAFCQSCLMTQLVTQPEPEKMFNASYPFFTSSSQKMTAHFTQHAEHLLQNHLSMQDPFVVEIGSNDGTFLKTFAQKNIRHLGIEPSQNVAAVAREQDIQTESVFFNTQTAHNIVNQHSKAHAIVSANVICHIPDLHAVFEGAQILLDPQGKIFFEDPYLGDILTKTAYDQIYDEHVFYFCLSSMQKLAEAHGLEVIDAIPLWTHGGSMRYVMAHKGVFAISDAVATIKNREQSLNIQNLTTYQNFSHNCQNSRDQLTHLLTKLKQNGATIIGYAATSKSTTVTNYCHLTPDIITAISDTTPLKQNKLNPGTHIPIISHATFSQNYPDYALLFGWNHAQEIMTNEQKFTHQGGQWIHYVPEIKIGFS